MNILIVSPVVLLIVLQAFSVSAQYKWHHQHGYSDYQYARYDLPRIEIRLPHTFNDRIFEDHFAQTIHGFQPFEQHREYVPELRLQNFQSPHDVYVEHHWQHPMLLPPIDPFRWSVESTVSMSFKIKVPTISNNDDIGDGYVKERHPTSETETKPATGIINPNIQLEAKNKPETDIKHETDKPGTDKQKTDKPKSVEPETDKPKTDTRQSEIDIKQETDKPNSVKPEIVKPDTDKPKTITSQPEKDIKHEIDKPNSVKPETVKPDTDKPKTNIEVETNKTDADIKPVTNKSDAQTKQVADIEPNSIKPDNKTDKATVTDITENKPETVGARVLETQSPKANSNIKDVESESTTTEDVTKTSNIESANEGVGSSTSTNDGALTQPTSIDSK